MLRAPSLIELLGHIDPEKLKALRAEHPENAKLFSTERDLGSGEMTSGQRTAIMDLVGKGLPAVAKDLDDLSKAIRVTMQKAANIRFVGAIVATVAGGISGIIALSNSNGVVQAVSAFLAMFGGIATVTADQFERAPSGRRIASTDEYASLVEARADVELIRLKVSQGATNPIGDSEVAAMLDRLNGHAMTVLKLKMA